MSEHVGTPCCDAHGGHCKPGGLCCEQCTEAEHPEHRTTRCTLPLSDIERDVLNTFAKAMGWTR